MSFHHRALAGAASLLSLSKASNLLFRKPQLRVLLYHDVPPDALSAFWAQLEYLATGWRFLQPQEFEAVVSGNVPLVADSLLLTFDDGFKSNKIVADEVLKPLGIKALFFVVPEFASISGKHASHEFICKNIYPELAIGAVPDHWCNMSWGDIETLAQEGHAIGSHTLTHARLSRLTSVDALETELMLSAEQLARRLGAWPDHLAYTFGDISSVSAMALGVASRHYRFIHSGLRGNNAEIPSPLAIRRESVFARDSYSLLDAYLMGLADFSYGKSRGVLDGWAADVHETWGARGRQYSAPEIG